MKGRIVTLLVAAFVWPAACAGPGGDDSDSQTNWLARCAADADCRGGLSCRCGVCTRDCTSLSACSGLAGGATCLDVPPASACGAAGEVHGVCTAPCGASSACRGGAECREGLCVPVLAVERRAPDGGADATGAADPPPDAPASTPPDADPDSASSPDAGADAAGGCNFNIPAGGCQLLPENPYGGSMIPADCPYMPWADGCIDYFICLLPCEKAEDCPAGGSGDATPSCDLAGETVGACRLDCGEGTVCPTGMACVTRPGDDRKGCYWATDFDCPPCPVFPSCANH